MARKGGATVTVATVNTAEEWGDLCSREVIHIFLQFHRVSGVFLKYGQLYFSKTTGCIHRNLCSREVIHIFLQFHRVSGVFLEYGKLYFSKTTECIYRDLYCREVMSSMCPIEYIAWNGEVFQKKVQWDGGLIYPKMTKKKKDIEWGQTSEHHPTSVKRDKMA